MTNSLPPASSSRPFAAAPDLSRYFPASAIEEARQRIGRSVQRGEGPVLVIGAAGLGKTMLLEVIAAQFRGQLHSILLVGGQICTRRGLLQMILFQLELPYRGMDESELRLSLLSYLQGQNANEEDTAARRILLLVDEADVLPPRLLEELRVLTNLSEAGQLLVNLVLAGNATLEEQFADPQLDLFSQRVSARCYLTAYGRDETFQYIRAQVAASGSDPAALFTEDGLEAIFAATDGMPRLINQLGDQLLWMVAETGYSPLDGGIVQQAWSELQQLPVPWSTPSNEPVGSPIEYGELDPTVSAVDVCAGSVDGIDACEASVREFDANDSSAGECDESNDEDECYSDDFDDMPASIPINTPQPIEPESPSVDLSTIETFDATAQLLEQLSDMDAAPIEPESSDAAEVPSARNPFAEAFDSEEIVLDRYSTFESLLLAEAPRVANRSDTAFAQQLQQFEALEGSIVESPPGVIVEATVPDNSPLADEEATDSNTSNLDSLNELGEVLVIEDSDQGVTEIVQGQKFRQLFSSLEATDDKSCFG